MKIPIAQRLSYPRDRVFAALTDPALLQRCIDGCEKMTPTGEDAYDVVIKVGIARLKGNVKLTAKQPPESMTLAVEGKGFPGSVKGSASLRLAAVDGGTEITGEGDVTVGGLIAAVGPRLIEENATKMMADFFSRVATQINSAS